ncbi:carboxylate-amine ligase [Streptomyces sp. NBC_00162]|uniref:carboxylate-amine ligase n=1 Tax=Streptomyces sp. NBC_00162 TaxID=2903629 RepID=UPI00214C3DF3|nr:glutamate--cysteine ligase [Streptomyces sp. NBC_00162]UUU38638.1 glutamate--cysteine ligase [Streptomyces sp. NBC_00162]
MTLILPTPAGRDFLDRPDPQAEPALPSGLVTMGVEEEFLLVDRHTRAPSGSAPHVLEAAATVLGSQAQGEFYTAQVEVCTQPVSTAAALRAELVRLRRVMGDAAAGEGCLLVASGTPVTDPAEPLTVSDDERYQRMAHGFAAALGQYDGIVCGCHIHVGVTSRAQALALANHMRPWLPTLQHLAANSPFVHGRDTSYASRRAVEHTRWPTVGPAPMLPDEAAYEEAVTSLMAERGLLDRRMIYWYARPSEHVPTLEIRVADVNADVDTVVLLAALVRALATTLLTDISQGRPVPMFPETALYEAHRMAARHGMEGVGLDPATGCTLPAHILAERLLAKTAPALAVAGDLSLVEQHLWQLRTYGGGAARQRAAYGHHGRLRDVVDYLAETTAAA